MNQDIDFKDKLKILPQYCIPHHLLSRLVYWLARCEITWFKNFIIKQFIRIFKVDMSLARKPNPTAYESFNSFFTRALSKEARPLQLGEKNIICPVDGIINQIGKINNNTLIQAKGKSYTLQQLLVDDKLATMFTEGIFATLYLAPKDYHRIHMPTSGQLSRMLYVPGKLFSVDAFTLRMVDAVFAKNERVINIFDIDSGVMAMIMVGALNVGSMETVWAGQVTPAKNRTMSDTSYTYAGDINLQQGQEMGRFNMGSTLILLFPKGIARWSAGMVADRPIVMGEHIGNLRP